MLQLTSASVTNPFSIIINYKHLVPLNVQPHSELKICLSIVPNEGYTQGDAGANKGVIKMSQTQNNIANFPEAIYLNNLRTLLVKLEQTSSAIVTAGIMCLLMDLDEIEEVMS